MGRREGATIDSTHLFLRNGWGVATVTPSHFQRKKAKGGHGLRPSLLGRWSNVATSTPTSPRLQREEEKGRPWPLPLSSWKVDEGTHISPREDRREGVAMASILLFLKSGLGCGHSHSISSPEGRRGGVAMASDFLCLQGGAVWPQALPPHLQREEGKWWPWPLPFSS